MRNSIKLHFTPKQVCQEGIQERSYSKSPLKPLLYVDEVVQRYLNDEFQTPIYVMDSFKSFRRRDFLNAHTEKYVNNFFDGKKGCESNSLPWSKKLAQSVRWTNASLFNAIDASYQDPNAIHISPTSGFHHAGPTGGSGFCTFSGQVIASLKMYRKYGARGAYLDLDGHYGNSIPDSRRFVKSKYGWELDDIIQMNINPRGAGKNYIEDLQASLKTLARLIKDGSVDYIVWCHGADSHKDDDLGHQCTTKQWRYCSLLFYKWLNELEKSLGRKIPLVLTLFGGYRKDHYQSVINLHVSDLYIALNELCGEQLTLESLEVREKGGYLCV